MEMENYCFIMLSCDSENLEMGTFPYTTNLLLLIANPNSKHTGVLVKQPFLLVGYATFHITPLSVVQYNGNKWNANNKTN